MGRHNRADKKRKMSLTILGIVALAAVITVIVFVVIDKTDNNDVPESEKQATEQTLGEDDEAKGDINIDFSELM